MLSRLTLAAMHFNANCGRKQAMCGNGEKQYSIHFPKYKKGEPTVRERKTECTYADVDKLLRTSSTAGENIIQIQQPCPPPICASYPHPDKTEVVNQLKSRFNFFSVIIFFTPLPLYSFTPGN
ncbi:hypothetical protein SNE40_015565 [Patella caerulea]|uniref:Uncharacterized protein n=1 Tax=Patella caerulea TaxID=87958 RepID=A0AAN8JK78_PATCE